MTTFLEKGSMFIKNIITFFLGGRSLGQFIRYLITGFSSFFIEYGIFYMLFQQFRVYELYANSIAIGIVFCYNFTLNRIWSFKSKEPLIKQLIQYGVLLVVNMTLSNVIIYIMSELIGITPLISKVFAMGLIVMWNFIIYKLIIFKQDDKTEEKLNVNEF